MKKCSKCDIVIPSNCRSGLCLRCRKSKNQYQKEYREFNRDAIKETRRRWGQDNQDYRKNRYTSDLNFRLKCNLRSRINTAIKNNQKTGSAISDLGCSIEFLKKHLENQWQEGMTWENYGLYGWHIDHIQPLDYFDLSNKEEFLKACHYTNLQPLWAGDNLSKSNKVNNIDNTQ